MSEVLKQFGLSLDDYRALYLRMRVLMYGIKIFEEKTGHPIKSNLDLWNYFLKVKQVISRHSENL